MTFFQGLALVLGLVIFALKMFLVFLSNRGRPLAKRLPPDKAIDSLMTSAIFGILLSMATTNLPDLEEKLGYLKGLASGDPLYTIFTQATDVRNRLANISDPEIRNMMSDVFRYYTTGYSQSLQQLQETDPVISKDQVFKLTGSIIQKANNSIMATSFVDQKWWSSAEAREYIAGNAIATAHGLDIERIFIYRNSDEYRALIPALQQQTAAKIHVYTIRQDQVSPDFLQDLIIIDGKFAGILKVDNNDRRFDDLVVKYDTSVVGSMRTSWLVLRSLAQPFRGAGAAQ